MTDLSKAIPPIANRFALLDLMRWFLAIIVAAGHLGGFFSPEKTYLAVDFFFILSGFVLTGAYVQKVNDENFLVNFVIDRLARLYPLHLVTLIILLFINVYFYLSTDQYLEAGWSYQDGYLYTFVLNLLLLQNIGLTESSSWNAPSWSISVELIINIAIAVLFAKHVRSWPWSLAISIVCYIILYNNFGGLYPYSPNIYGFISTGLLRGLAGLSLGITAWHIYLIIRHKLFYFKMISMASTSAFIGIVLFGSIVKNADFLAIIIAFVAVVSSAVYETQRPIFNGKVQRVMFMLGASSYAIYLIHWPIISFIKYQLVYALGWSINVSDLSTTLIVLICTALISIPIYILFELPAKRAIKLRFKVNSH